MRMQEAIYTEKIIRYDLILRDYGIPYEPNGIDTLHYCPWCGVKLPDVLNAKIFDVLEKEYGIDNPDIWEFTNVPEEFKTDEWWKKRGL